MQSGTPALRRMCPTQCNVLHKTTITLVGPSNKTSFPGTPLAFVSFVSDNFQATVKVNTPNALHRTTIFCSIHLESSSSMICGLYFLTCWRRPSSSSAKPAYLTFRQVRFSTEFYRAHLNLNLLSINLPIESSYGSRFPQHSS